MKLEKRRIETIRPYERNPRVIPERAIKAVAKSIEEFGWQQPIVVDADGVIIAGHTRYLAAKVLNPVADSTAARYRDKLLTFPRYCDTIVQRFEDFTGQEVTRATVPP